MCIETEVMKRDFSAVPAMIFHLGGKMKILFVTD